MTETQKERWSGLIVGCIKATVKGRGSELFQYLGASDNNRRGFFYYIEDALAPAINDVHDTDYWDVRQMIEDKTRSWYLWWYRRHIEGEAA